MGNGIAIFDFCETMVDFQSADEFVHYVIANSEMKVWSKIIDLNRRILLKTRMIRVLQLFDTNSYVNKRILLHELKGVRRSDLEYFGKQFFLDRIVPHFVPEVINELVRYRDMGWTVCILSGGYDIYLEYVKNHFNIEHLICTRLDYKNGYFTGRYRGKDCIRKEKLLMFKNYFGFNVFEENDTVFYTDSITDLPMLRECKKGVVVYKDTVPSWANINGMEVLSCRG